MSTNLSTSRVISGQRRGTVHLMGRIKTHQLMIHQRISQVRTIYRQELLR